MVDMAAARMTPVTPDPAAVDPYEIARVELVEALARMVNRARSIEEIRTTLAEVANIDDFLDDLDAAKRMLCLYLST